MNSHKLLDELSIYGEWSYIDNDLLSEVPRTDTDLLLMTVGVLHVEIQFEDEDKYYVTNLWNWDFSDRIEFAKSSDIGPALEFAIIMAKHAIRDIERAV